MELWIRQAGAFLLQRAKLVRGVIMDTVFLMTTTGKKKIKFPFSDKGLNIHTSIIKPPKATQLQILNHHL